LLFLPPPFPFPLLPSSFSSLPLPLPPSYIVRAGDDAADAQWFAFGALPPIAFDHRKIIDSAWKRVMSLPGVEGEEYYVIEKGSGEILITLKDSKEAEVVSMATPFPE